MHAPRCHRLGVHGVKEPSQNRVERALRRKKLNFLFAVIVVFLVLVLTIRTITITTAVIDVTFRKDERHACNEIACCFALGGGGGGVPAGAAVAGEERGELVVAEVLGEGEREDPARAARRPGARARHERDERGRGVALRDETAHGARGRLRHRGDERGKGTLRSTVAGGCDERVHAAHRVVPRHVRGPREAEQRESALTRLCRAQGRLVCRPERHQRPPVPVRPHRVRSRHLRPSRVIRSMQ